MSQLFDKIMPCDPERIKNEALEYLNKKYNREFVPYKLKTAELMTDDVFLAGSINDETMDVEMITRVNVHTEENGDDKQMTFTDDFCNYAIIDACTRSLYEIAGRYVKKSFIKCSGLYGSHVGGKDDIVEMTNEELIEEGGRCFGRWFLYLESSKSADEFSSDEQKLIQDIRDSGIYGYYSLYLVEENALLMIDNYNYMDYLPDKNTADGIICKEFRKYSITNEVN